MLQLLQEPLVNLGQVVYLVYGVALMHSLRDNEDSLVCWLHQSFVYIGYFQFLVFHVAVHTLPYHAQTFLYGFLEVTANSHHLAHGLHG